MNLKEFERQVLAWQNHRFRSVFYDTIRQSGRVLEKKPMTKLTLAFKSLSHFNPRTRVGCDRAYCPVCGLIGSRAVPNIPLRYRKR